MFIRYKIRYKVPAWVSMLNRTFGDLFVYRYPAKQNQVKLAFKIYFSSCVSIEPMYNKKVTEIDLNGLLNVLTKRSFQ